MFERDSVPGGNWHYTDETPVDAPIPNADVAVGDYMPSLPPGGVELPYSEEYLDDDSDRNSYFDRRREHRGPKPIWKSLTSNVPSPYQENSLGLLERNGSSRITNCAIICVHSHHSTALTAMMIILTFHITPELKMSKSTLPTMVKNEDGF